MGYGPPGGNETHRLSKEVEVFQDEEVEVSGCSIGKPPQDAALFDDLHRPQVAVLVPSRNGLLPGETVAFLGSRFLGIGTRRVLETLNEAEELQVPSKNGDPYGGKACLFPKRSFFKVVEKRFRRILRGILWDWDFHHFCIDVQCPRSFSGRNPVVPVPDKVEITDFYQGYRR